MKIGIIGSSSQVGSSVAYYLSRYPGVDVVCFIRSSYSEPFFDLMGLRHEHLDVSNKAAMRNQLDGIHTILDFSYPAGPLFSIKDDACRTIEAIISCMSRDTVFIYMSSIMAYGMAPDEKYIRNYIIPRSSYARIKRAAEGVAQRVGRQNGVTVYNFRLGQVHGIHQSVNLTFRKRLGGNGFTYIDGLADDPTTTIFTNSVAEAVMKCSAKECAAGTYALVSTPQWTLKELYEYYLKFYGLTKYLLFAPGSSRRKPERLSFPRAAFQFLESSRPMLEAYLLMNAPSIATKLKGRYRQAEVVRFAARAPAAGTAELDLLGKPPRILRTSNSAIATVSAEERDYETYYHEALMQKRR